LQTSVRQQPLHALAHVAEPLLPPHASRRRPPRFRRRPRSDRLLALVPGAVSDAFAGYDTSSSPSSALQTLLSASSLFVKKRASPAAKVDGSVARSTIARARCLASKTRPYFAVDSCPQFSAAAMTCSARWAVK